MMRLINLRGVDNRKCVDVFKENSLKHVLRYDIERKDFIAAWRRWN